MGYSIIPVKFNKVPAVPWKRYMTRFAPSATHHKWWERDEVSGIGIVTGSISHLAVLDFDNLEIYLDFRQKLPLLARTYSVRTRRGLHLYFRIPTNLSTRTQKLEGIDWLWDGAYVVAPPSTIQGITYRVIQEGQPLMPTAQQLTDIEIFLSGYEKTRQNNANREDLRQVKPVDLLTYYEKTAQQGRNNALFKTACLARDNGYSHQQVATTLLSTFVHDQKRKAREAESKRELEGLKTIDSAFSRPTRANHSLPAEDKVGLPNVLREKLLHEKLTTLLRVWEGLNQQGNNTPSYITESTIIQSLKGIVGQHSIRKALTTTYKGKIVFQKTKNQKTKKPPKRFSKLCNLDRVSKPKKIGAGRKTIYYRIPTVAELCRLFEVDSSLGGSDPLTQEDLKSARKTRSAMHRAFICRCSGHYPRGWLAKRLGVSIRTLQRYHALDANIHLIPVFLYSRLTWQNLACISDECLWGTFLEDSAGKRYPPLKVIARKFLKENIPINYLRQGVNYYCYGTSYSHLSRILLRDPIMEIETFKTEQAS